MSIINTIDYQLNEVLKLLNEDLKNGTVTYNFFLNEDNERFLDIHALKSYLTETKIENLTSLKSICRKCIDIVEIWNYKMDKLPDNKFEETFFYSDEKQKKFLSTILEFHALYITKEKIINYNTLIGKKAFVEEHDYNTMQISKLASICNNILIYCTNCYPDINEDFDPQYYYSHYKKTNRFNFQSILKPFSKNEFSGFENRLEKYLFRYQYIYENIELENKHEFKRDVLDHLKNVEAKQIHSKYKIALNDVITIIEADFSHDVNTMTHVNEITLKHNPNKIHNYLESFYFFQVYFETQQGKERTNDSIITPENWENKKAVFFQQRMERHKNSYTLKERIILELDYLNNLTITKPDYKILADRYKSYLINQETQQMEISKTDESYKNEILFKVGLLFANGEMEKYYLVNNKNETVFKNGYSAPKVARDLGHENYNKYILATVNNYPKNNPNGNKNIFNSIEKMNKIIAHCEAKNITVIPYFKERLPIE